MEGRPLNTLRPSQIYRPDVMEDIHVKAELGNDTVVSDATADERVEIRATLSRHGVKGPEQFRKIVSGRKLWNYDKKELDVWKAAF